MLSIIIPTYNRVDLIKYTLASVNEIHHPGVLLEIIVIDDGSDDNTWEYVSTYHPHVRLLKNAKKGASSARNTGLAASTGKYVVYLDSDDLIGEGFFKEKITLLENNPGLDACYGEYEDFASRGELHNDHIVAKYKYPLIKGKENAQKHLINYLEERYIPSLAIVWRKDFLLKFNGHDDNLMINQDVDLFIRAVFHGLKIESIADGTKVYIRNHNIDVRIGDTSRESKKWRQILEHRKRIFDSLAKYNYDNIQSRKALSNFIFSYWRKLRHKEKEIAKEYLDFAKQVYWPVETNGNAGMKLLSKVFGVVGAIKLKYFILKRD